MSDADRLRAQFQELIVDNAQGLLHLLEARSKFAEMQGEILAIGLTDAVEVTDTVRALKEIEDAIVRMMASISTVTQNLTNYRDRL